jgi:malonate transporter
MTDFLQIFSITVPIFAVIFLGFAATRLGLLPANSNDVLGAFVVKFALPALLFQAISQRQVSEIIDPWYLLAYGGGSVAAFLAVFLLVRGFARHKPATAAMFAMGASFSNSLMIGYPIALQVFGEAALVPITLTVMVETFIMLPLAITLAESIGQGHVSWRKTALTVLARLAKNPIIGAILLGVVCSVLGLRLPAAADRTIDMFASTVSGVALFAIGGLLVGMQVKAMLGSVLPVVVAKLILHPAMVFGAYALISALVGVEIQSAAILLACMPVVGIFPMIGTPYGVAQECAAVVVLTTVLSFLTLSIAIWLI